MYFLKVESFLYYFTDNITLPINAYLCVFYVLYTHMYDIWHLIPVVQIMVMLSCMGKKKSVPVYISR